ncbi:MAG: ATP-binding cassette domain-containing protein [Pseudoclavibacter sp.]
MNAPVLDVRNLTAAITHRGPARVVVDDVSFELEAGRSLAIVGESGAGKSMLVRSILGVHPPGVDIRVTGSVTLDGHDMLALRGRAKRRVLAASVGMIHQDPLRSLNPTYRVGQQLTETLEFSGAAGRRTRQQKAVAAMEQTGFRAAAEESRRFPHELSGGQRQRIGISAATLTEPALLIGDEPTTALDVTVQRRVLDVMDETRCSSSTRCVRVT